MGEQVKQEGKQATVGATYPYRLDEKEKRQGSFQAPYIVELETLDGLLRLDFVPSMIFAIMSPFVSVPSSQARTIYSRLYLSFYDRFLILPTPWHLHIQLQVSQCPLVMSQTSCGTNSFHPLLMKSSLLRSASYPSTIILVMGSIGTERLPNPLKYGYSQHSPCVCLLDLAVDILFRNWICTAGGIRLILNFLSLSTLVRDLC